MIVNEAGSGRQYLPLVQQLTEAGKGTSESTGKFVDSLKEFVTDVNTFQKESGELTAMMIKGEPVDLHDVMIAAEKAKTSFQLLLEIRNKFTDMYQQINRMQV